jgi:hypothetical protein
MKTQTLKKRKDVKMDDNRDDNLKNFITPIFEYSCVPKMQLLLTI